MPRGRRRRFLKTCEKPTGELRPLSRARNQAREPRRRETRARGRAPARITRDSGSRRQGSPGKRQWPTGRERNATEEWYAGTERQGFTEDMGNMTSHDTSEGTGRKRRALRLARNQAREPRRRETRAGGRRRRRALRATQGPTAGRRRRRKWNETAAGHDMRKAGAPDRQAAAAKSPSRLRATGRRCVKPIGSAGGEKSRR